MQTTLKTVALLVLALVAWCGFGGTVLAQTPAISSFSPTSGTVGTTITITGTNFNRNSSGALWSGAIPYSVRFPIGGGVANVTPTYVSATTIRAVVPAGAVTGPISLAQGFTVMSTSTTSFTVINQPRITGFTPASGPVGTVVTINGSSFNRDVNGATWTGAIPWRVRFATATGTTDVLPTYFSASTVTVTVPAGAATGLLRLVQGATIMSTSATNYTVVANGTLRITNNSQYDMVSLTLNNVQKFGANQGVPIAGTNDFLVAPGTYTLVAGIGFYTSTGARDVLFTYTRTVTITSGAINAQAFAPITLASLLTAGSASRRWNGIYLTGDNLPHVATYAFSSNGGWTLQDDGVAVASGTTSLVSWPNRSTIVSFRTIAGGPVAQLDIRTAKFLQQIGPASWPVIEFVRE